jgi:drug/metabolite transporter (DMT)-like permease
MLLSAASFSVMSFLAHTLKDTFSWQGIAVVRTAIALVLTILLARAAGAQLVLFKPGTLWIRSIAGSVALLANFFSMTHYPVSEVLALSNMFPLWVAVLSWPVLGERPRLDVWLAALTGVIGVFVLQPPRAEAALGDFGTLPVVTAVTASLASSIALLGLHRLKGVDTRAVVAHFSGVSLAFSGAAMLAWPGLSHAHPASATAIGVLLLVGVAATSGQLFLTKAFASGPPAQISVIGLSQVGFSMLMEIVFLGRQFNERTLLGLALIVAPTAWVLVRRRKNRPPLAPGSDDAGLAETAKVANGD